MSIFNNHPDLKERLDNGEEFITLVKELNMRNLHKGVEFGWWEDVDEKRGMPIPFPIVINVFAKPDHWKMAHVVTEAGLFPSVTLAMKNGFNVPIKLGEHFLFKRTKKLLVVWVSES